MLTVRLNTAVAVRVAATETVAVVVAVAKISGLGNGTDKSVPGTSKYWTSDLGGGCGIGESTGLGAGFSSVFSSSVLTPSTPGGGRRSLGGTTSGLYEGKTALGTSSTGGGNTGGSGSRRTGSTGGCPKSISHQKDHAR
jgi:hypothetical protein